jgi:hypothetical protein
MKKRGFDSHSFLGEARAEQDPLLSRTFVETTEYATLRQWASSYVVVGRRGTGKSALFNALRDHASKDHRVLIVLQPDGDEVLPVRAIVEHLTRHNHSYDNLREVSTLLCRYMLLMEIVSVALDKSLLDGTARDGLLADEARGWLSEGTTPLERLYGKCIPTLQRVGDSGILLGELNRSLQYRRILAAVKEDFAEASAEIALLADRLDEGFQPEDAGVAFINGLVSAASDLYGVISGFRPVVFLRDNIFRSIQKNDRNYSRNIEGSIVRLHWSEEGLFRLVNERLVTWLRSPSQNYC